MVQWLTVSQLWLSDEESRRYIHWRPNGYPHRMSTGFVSRGVDMAASAPCFLMSCTLPFVAFPVCLWRTCNNNSKHSTGTTTLTPTSLPTPQHQPRNHSTFATQNLSSPETRGSTNIVHSMSRSLHQVLVVSTTLSGKTHTSIILLSHRQLHIFAASNWRPGDSIVRFTKPCLVLTGGAAS